MSNAPSIGRQVLLIALVAFAGCYKEIPPELDAKRDLKNLFDALTAKVLDDLKTDWLTPTVPQPYERGWLIQAPALDSARESAFRAKVLALMGARIATETDARIENLKIYQGFIGVDSALVYVDRGRVWCQGSTVSMVGNVYEYRLARDRRGWRVRVRNPGMFYDPPPPPPSPELRSTTCVPAALR